jgi:hypothetical protein
LGPQGGSVTLCDERRNISRFVTLRSLFFWKNLFTRFFFPQESTQGKNARHLRAALLAYTQGHRMFFFIIRQTLFYHPKQRLCLPRSAFPTAEGFCFHALLAYIQLELLRGLGIFFFWICLDDESLSKIQFPTWQYRDSNNHNPGRWKERGKGKCRRLFASLILFIFLWSYFLPRKGFDCYESISFYEVSLFFFFSKTFDFFPQEVNQQNSSTDFLIFFLPSGGWEPASWWPVLRAISDNFTVTKKIKNTI